MIDLFGIDSSSPFNLTGGDLEQKLLSSLLGNDPAASMLISMALPHINKFLGLTSSSSNRSALLDMTLMSNMTPYGIYRDTLNNTANRLAGNALSNQSKAARRRWLENFNRTTMSFESWQGTKEGQAVADLSPAEQEQAYNNYIANQTAGQMNNFLCALCSVGCVFCITKVVKFFSRELTGQSRQGTDTAYSAVKNANGIHCPAHGILSSCVLAENL